MLEDFIAIIIILGIVGILIVAWKIGGKYKEPDLSAKKQVDSATTQPKQADLPTTKPNNNFMGGGLRTLIAIGIIVVIVYCVLNIMGYKINPTWFSWYLGPKDCPTSVKQMDQYSHPPNNCENWIKTHSEPFLIPSSSPVVRIEEEQPTAEQQKVINQRYTEQQRELGKKYIADQEACIKQANTTAENSFTNACKPENRVKGVNYEVCAAATAPHDGLAYLRIGLYPVDPIFQKILDKQDSDLANCF